jgi:integrase
VGAGATANVETPLPIPPAGRGAHRAREALIQADKERKPVAWRPKKKPGDAPVEIKNFGDFLTKWYAPKILDKRAHEATIQNLKAQFCPSEKSEKFSGVDLSNRALRLITEDDIDKFKEQRLKAGISPVTINRDLDRLRAALRMAVERKLLDSAPTIRHLKVDKDLRVRFLTPDEEKRLRKALLDRERLRRRQRKTANTRLRERQEKERHQWAANEFTDHVMPIVLVAWNTGLRRGSLLGLTWEAVDLERRQIMVSATTSKSRKTQYLPLNAEALDVLARWKRQGSGTGPVFPGVDGEQLGHTKRSWDGLVKAAGLSDFRFHDLRHNFASQLTMKGENLRTVQTLLGHADSKMTERYAHLAPEHLQAAVAKLGAKKR